MIVYSIKLILNYYLYVYLRKYIQTGLQYDMSLLLQSTLHYTSRCKLGRIRNVQKWIPDRSLSFCPVDFCADTMQTGKKISSGSINNEEERKRLVGSREVWRKGGRFQKTHLVFSVYWANGEIGIQALAVCSLLDFPISD